MSAETEVSTWQWVIGILVLIMLGIWGVLERGIGALRHRVEDENTNLWAAIDEAKTLSASGQTSAALMFATRKDVEDLRGHFDRALTEHEYRMRETLRDLLNNREPVRSAIERHRHQQLTEDAGHD